MVKNWDKSKSDQRYEEADRSQPDQMKPKDQKKDRQSENRHQSSSTGPNHEALQDTAVKWMI